MKEYKNGFTTKAMLDENNGKKLFDINLDDDFDTVFGQIAESMGFEYSIDSDHVFDSPGCDIYCKAVVVLNEDGYDNALLTFEHC